MNYKTKILVVVVPLAIIGVVMGFLFFRKTGSVTVKPKRGPLVEAIYGLGKVKSDRRYDLKIGVSMTIKKVHVSEGDFVKKGSPLMEFETGATFSAPFNGTVTLVVSRAGEVAVPHTTQLRLEDLKYRFIELSIEQEAALRVQPGQPVKVSFETLRGERLDGKVASLFSRDDEFIARIDVLNLSDSVLPGMTADVSVEVGKIDNALLIPVRAVSSGTVSVKRNGRTQKVKLEIGHVDGQWAEVKSGGLSETDEIILPKAIEE